MTAHTEPKALTDARHKANASRAQYDHLAGLRLDPARALTHDPSTSAGKLATQIDAAWASWFDHALEVAKGEGAIAG